MVLAAAATFRTSAAAAAEAEWVLGAPSLSIAQLSHLETYPL